MVVENQGADNGGSGTTDSGSSGAEHTGSGDTKELSADAEREASQNPEPMEETSEAGEKEKAVVKPAYTPNYKFKVMDKENEFDPWLKPIIKDADTEKKVRELYEKAHGLDYVKQSREQLEERYNQIAPQAHQDRQIIESVVDMVAKEDIESVQKALRISDDAILKQALKIIQIREMPADQRQAYEASQQAAERAQMLEQQNSHLMTENQQVGMRMREQELSWTLQRPDISQFANAYDARVGQPGAFKRAMIERGQFHAIVNKVDMSPEQVAMDVVKFLGGPTALIPQPPSQVVAPVAQQAKPVITNVQGKGTSPAKKVFKSLKDVKQYAKERSLASNE